MPKETVTSMDVAKRAGVSQSAVSRVYTPGASVSKKTAEKVKRAAKELGYRKNTLAKSLITGKSKIIGVVVAYLENQYYPDVIEKLTNALQYNGYHVMMILASQTAGNIEGLMDEILDYQVDGIVLASVAMSSELAKRCNEAGIPVILFNRYQDDVALNAVTSDNYEGGRKLAHFLAQNGHQNIGYIAGWEGATTQRDRERGFVGGLKEAGLKLCAREVGNFHFDEAQEAAKRMFAVKKRPDAVFAANDHMAFAVIEALRYDLKLRVPEDVSVVGYDDVPLASWRSYDLTTVRQPSNRMVEATVDILLKTIEQGDHTSRHISIDGPLIVRGSARIAEGQKT